MILKNNRRYLFVIQQTEGWLLIIEEIFTWKKVFSGADYKGLNDICVEINSILKLDDRFSDIKSYTQNEYEKKSNESFQRI